VVVAVERTSVAPVRDDPLAPFHRTSDAAVAAGHDLGPNGTGPKHHRDHGRYDAYDAFGARIEAGEIEPVVVVAAESWLRVDLGPTLRGEVEPVLPTLLCRDDGPGLFYPGRVNELHADSGIGKTWAALEAAKQELKAGRTVGWIDYEEPDATTAVSRLRALGCTDDEIAAGLHYHSPKDPTSLLALDLLVAEITDAGVGLVVIDSLGEAFGLDSVNEDRDNEVGPWLRRVARTLADTGAAVVLIDHSTKSNDNPLHPSGSKRKRAAITGASYMVEAVQPLTRAEGGRLRLTCAKDRHGHYRRGEVAAEIALTVYPDDGMTVHIYPPDPDANEPDARLGVVARAAVRAVKDADTPPSTRVLVELMKVKAARNLKLAAIEHAANKGAIRPEPAPRNATLYHYVRDL